MNLKSIKINIFLNKIKNKFINPNESEKIKFLKSFKDYPDVKSINQTIDQIKSGKSITRLGDGEFMLISGKSIGFQKYEKSLAKSLLRAFQVPNSNCIVAIPKFEEKTFNDFWINYWYENIKWISNSKNKDKSYFNLGVSRQFKVEQALKLKESWKGRNVIFV